MRFAFRLMRKNAVFSLTAAGSLALSIGALTMAFSAVNAIVFKPLPIADPERSSTHAERHRSPGRTPTIAICSERLDVDALAGYRISMMNVGLEPEPSILWGYLATGNYFEALGVTPAAGRFFTPAKTPPRRGAQSPCSVTTRGSHALAGAHDVVGSTIPINGRPFTIIGVAPRGFHGTESVLPSRRSGCR